MLNHSACRKAVTGVALVLATATVVGCGPDRVTASSDLAQQPPRPAASIANLPTTAPRLYDQYSSRNGGTGTEGALMADDFVVPSGQTWTRTQVVISGWLGAATLTFAIRADNAGVPGVVLPGTSFTMAPVASDPNACGCGATDNLFTLPTPVTLTAGTYWLTINSSLQFAWQSRDDIVGSVERRSFNGTSWLVGLYDRAFVLFGTGGQEPQAITFPAVTPNPATVGGSAALGATANSGLAVSYTSLTTDVCTVAASTVSYIAAGTCTVAADQAGNDDYFAAERVTQDVTVNQATQAITFTSTPPASPTVGGTYAVTATGGTSGNPVKFGTSTPNVCAVAGNVVTFVTSGACTVTADQAGNANYTDAPQQTQTFTVNKAAQAIAFTSTPPS